MWSVATGDLYGCDGVACGNCPDLDHDGYCPPLTTNGSFDLSWSRDGLTIPVEVTSIALMAECKDSAGAVVLPWVAYVSGSPTLGSLSFGVTLGSVITHCKVQVEGKNAAGTPVWWANRMDAVHVVVGHVSYVYDDGVNLYQVNPVGSVTNNQGGFDFGFDPGTDSDGDGVLDTTDAAPFNAVVQ